MTFLELLLSNRAFLACLWVRRNERFECHRFCVPWKMTYSYFCAGVIIVRLKRQWGMGPEMHSEAHRTMSTRALLHPVGIVRFCFVKLGLAKFYMGQWNDTHLYMCINVFKIILTLSLPLPILSIIYDTMEKSTSSSPFLISRKAIELGKVTFGRLWQSQFDRFPF